MTENDPFAQPDSRDVFEKQTPSEVVRGTVMPPPEDVDAERDLIGACLMGGIEVTVQVMATVSAADFTRSLSGEVFTAMENLTRRGEAIDFSTVRSECERGFEANERMAWTPEHQREISLYLTDAISGVPTYAHANQYAATIRTVSVRRKMLGVANEIARLAFTGGGRDGNNEITLVGEAQAAFDALLQHHASGSSILTGRDLAFEYTEVLEKREKRDPEYVGFETGYPDLDANQVAYRPGELWYIAASPGVGKTALCKDLQWSLFERDIPSMFVSLEQPRIQLMDRLVSTHANVDAWRLTTGRASFHERQSIDITLAKLVDRPGRLLMVDDQSINTARLDALVRLAKAKYGIKVCFVDYLQLMTDDYGEGNDNQRVGYIGRRLAAIARATRTTMVAASQVNRAGSVPGIAPEMVHLRDSGVLEATAFTIITLGRKPDSPITEVKIAKNRNGKTGSISLYFTPEKTHFTSMSREVSEPVAVKTEEDPFVENKLGI